MKRIALSFVVGAGLFAFGACVGSDPTPASPDAAVTPQPDTSTPLVDAATDTSQPSPDAEAGTPVDAANPCPYSKVGTNGRCEPVCGVRFTLGQDIAPGAAPSPSVVSVDGQGESTYGLADDGTFMFFSSSRTGIGAYAFARKSGAGYAVAEVPPADLASVEPGRAGQLLVDGRHALFVRANNTFAYGDADTTTGRITNLTDGPFSALNALMPAPANGYVSSPAISGDGLVFVYSVTSSNIGLDGIYQSRRATPQVPFPQSKKLVGGLTDITKYAAIEGLSYDGLTAFVFEGFTTRVFTRADTSDEFTTDLARSAIPAWRVNVASKCDTLVATRSPGGSQNQQVAQVVATP